MSGLKAQDGFAGEGDAFYEMLLAAHRGLGDAESAALDCRLVLILANEVGDLAILREALRAARASLDAGTERAEAATSGADPIPGRRPPP